METKDFDLKSDFYEMFGGKKKKNKSQKEIYSYDKI